MKKLFARSADKAQKPVAIQLSSSAPASPAIPAASPTNGLGNGNGSAATPPIYEQFRTVEPDRPLAAQHTRQQSAQRLVQQPSSSSEERWELVPPPIKVARDSFDIDGDSPPLPNPYSPNPPFMIQRTDSNESTGSPGALPPPVKDRDRDRGREGQKLRKPPQQQPPLNPNAVATQSILRALDPGAGVGPARSRSPEKRRPSPPESRVQVPAEPQREDKKDRKGGIGIGGLFDMWDRDKDKGPDKSKDKDKGKEREREREKEKEREREQRDREHREREHREREREKAQREDGTGGPVITKMIGFLTATASEDWSLVLEVCELASSSEANAKEAAKALRREFKYADAPAQLSAARLWAIMLRNGTELFLAQCLQKKFLDSVVDVVQSPRTSPVVRERLTDVVAAAAFATQRRPDGRESKDGFHGLWRKIKPADKPDEGYPFDADDAMFNPPLFRVDRPPPQPHPAHPHTYPEQLPVRSTVVDNQVYALERVDSHGLPIAPSQAQVQGQAHSPPIVHGHHHSQSQDRVRDEARPPMKSKKSARNRIIPLEEDMRRLFQECKVGRGNAMLLTDALRLAKPEDLRGEVIREFHGKCVASKELILRQVAWATAGAERSRREATAQGRPARKPGSRQNSYNSLEEEDGEDGDTVEEKLLGALLGANEDLQEALRLYDEVDALRIERETQERSRKETRIDRSKLQYDEEGHAHLDASEMPFSGGPSSRSGSPAPSLTSSSLRPQRFDSLSSLSQDLHNASDYYDSGGHSLSSTPPNANNLMPHGNASGLAVPRAPFGPRSPLGYPQPSRTPSPEPPASRPLPHASPPTQHHGPGHHHGLPVPPDRLHPQRVGRLQVHVQEGWEHVGGDGESLATPMQQISEKALGKRRDLDVDHIDESDQSSDNNWPPVDDDGYPSSDSERPNDRWHQPVKYVYDAAAERTKELLEGQRALVAIVNEVH